MLLGIIGNGFVGKATRQLKCKDLNIVAYDCNPESCDHKGTQLIDLLKCDVIFISVPTPMKKNGECYLGIIESVIDDLEKIKYEGIIVLRSTVPPGTSKKLNCCFMPEFLTERNYITDFINNKKWIFGVDETDTKDENVKNILTSVINCAYENDRIKYNDVVFMKSDEAEMVKMFRNVFLSTKISLCNEFAEYCDIKEIDYETVRKIATEDERITPSHTCVPGPDGKKGFGGTCFPKDTSSLLYDMTQNNMNSFVLKSVIARNISVDRVERDWEGNKGRSIVDE